MLKGKQVRILYDLVTVFEEHRQGEYRSLIECQTVELVTDHCDKQAVGVRWEGCHVCGSISQETCRVLGTGCIIRITRA